jgi:hypothetical protein
MAKGKSQSNFRNDGKQITLPLEEGPAHNHSVVLEKDGTINVSQSKVRTWRNCRREYHNKFILGLRKKKVKRPFMFGRIVHEMIEAHEEGHNPFELLDRINLDNGKMFRKEVEMYGNIIEDLRFIMTDYFSYWGDELVYIRKNGRSTEHEFRIELEPGVWFTGKIDAVGKAKRLRWLVEHKTFNRMPSEDDRWRSVQGAVYLRALEIMGWKAIDGILWDYVSSKPPATPGELLKNGTYSQKRISTLPTRLDAWLKEEGLKRKDYAKLRQEAVANQSNYFIRVYNPLRPTVVDRIWEDFVDTAKEIADFHGKKKDQNIGRHCSWCDFRELCSAEANGSDTDFVIRRLYTTEPEARTETVDRVDD